MKATPYDQPDHLPNYKLTLLYYTPCLQPLPPQPIVPKVMANDQQQLSAEMMKMITIAIATPITVLIILTLAAAMIIYSSSIPTATTTSRCEHITTLPGSSQDVGDGQQADTKTDVGIAPTNMDNKDHLEDKKKEPAMQPLVIKGQQAEAEEKPTGLPPWQPIESAPYRS